MALLTGAIAGGVFASEADGIFTFKVGTIEVSMLVESQRDGNAGILVGVDQKFLSRYIPETGFKHTANAFLLKDGDRNILVDTGTGAGGIIIGKITKLGVPPEKVDAILITHLHGDHFGSLQKDGKAGFPKAKIFRSAKERDYFTKTNVNAGAAAALAPYGSRVVAFEPGILGSQTKALLPGITAFASYGHTPGHTVFLVESGKDKLIIAADFLHVALVQFAEPDISASYDMDKEAAAASRRQVLDYAAKNKIPIGGMHVVYPGVGNVEAAGSGYLFTPLN
jgi:glyoxylase-like metal-dependent hydrolase (beta-lactamase superfamily II)